MKYAGELILILCLLCTLACGGKKDDQPLLEAEILGRDYSRWICGGGWKIKLDEEIIYVPELPNEQVMDIVSAAGFTEDTPLPVYITLNPDPTSTCAIQFDGQEELSFISLRN